MSEQLAPAERVKRLRVRYGSHDKLVVAVRAKAEELGLDLRPTRQRIIGYENSKGISADYARVLAALAKTDATVFRPTKPGPQFQGLQQEVRQLDVEVKELKVEVGEIRKTLEQRARGARKSR